MMKMTNTIWHNDKVWKLDMKSKKFDMNNENDIWIWYEILVNDGWHMMMTKMNRRLKCDERSMDL